MLLYISLRSHLNVHTTDEMGWGGGEDAVRDGEREKGVTWKMKAGGKTEAVEAEVN